VLFRLGLVLDLVLLLDLLLGLGLVLLARQTVKHAARSGARLLVLVRLILEVGVLALGTGSTGSIGLLDLGALLRLGLATLGGSDSRCD